MTDDYLCQVVHAEAKAGKTVYATTGPGTTLVLDSEAGGMRFVPGKKIVWNVEAGEPMPEAGDWRICQVPVTSIRTYQEVARDYLSRPDHPFNNVSMDSLTESQDAVKRERSPMFELEQRDWGYIFGVMNDMVVTYRDLVAAQPQMKSLTVVTGTQFRDGKFRPMLSGQFKDKLAYKLDAIAFLLKLKDEQDQTRRCLILGEHGNYEVGNRLGDNAPDVLWDPTITKLLNAVFGTDYEEVI